MLDTAVAIETPEGIDFDLVPSGPVARILAYLADLLIRGVVMIALSFFLGLLGGLGSGLILVCYFFLEWLYPVVFEVTKGATPGKKWLNLKVVHDDGTPVTLSSSLLRNLLRTADFLPFFYATGLISMLCNGQFKRLGDIAAGTLVVQLTPPQALPSQELPAPMLPPVALTQSEQAAVIQFTLRQEVLSKPRQAELVSILEPLMDKLPENAYAGDSGESVDEKRVKQLRQIGAYLLGKTGQGQTEQDSSVRAHVDKRL
ncbi:RDD family protein [Hahella ganghwensis]|uniref:RDD family protein n=1 Tax=Hahella ganghwensis TaxID=286420 RepID=UPI00037D06AF|nr:RDD family protein [Hahella ganghwensis]